jgi:hypothetical protein
MTNITIQEGIARLERFGLQIYRSSDTYIRGGEEVKRKYPDADPNDSHSPYYLFGIFNPFSIELEEDKWFAYIQFYQVGFRVKISPDFAPMVPAIEDYFTWHKNVTQVDLYTLLVLASRYHYIDTEIIDAHRFRFYGQFIDGTTPEECFLVREEAQIYFWRGEQKYPIQAAEDILTFLPPD